jgi:hypothetical protein
MYKHLPCAAFKIKLTTGSGNAGTCEKLPRPGQDPTPAKSRCVRKAPLFWDLDNTIVIHYEGSI